MVFGGLTGAAGAGRLLDMLGMNSSAEASRAAADGLKALGRDVIEMDMDDCKKAPARPAAGWPRIKDDAAQPHR